jgi:hypothetical protein
LYSVHVSSGVSCSATISDNEYKAITHTLVPV